MVGCFLRDVQIHNAAARSLLYPMKFTFPILSQRLMFPLLFLGVGLGLAQRCEGGLVGFEETGSMAQARAYHTATLLPDGKVLVASQSAELYDPADGTWTPTGSPANPRSRHTATLLPNGKVLVAGGLAGFNSLASAELYDPASGTWTPTGSLNAARYSHTATLLPDGKVLVAGGFFAIPFSIWGGYPDWSAEVYDPASGTWTTTAHLAEPRYYHTATLLSDGKVLVAGGQTGPGRFGPSIATTELYDPASGLWTTTGNLAVARANHTATLLPNGQVLAAGGWNNGNNLLASAELYDPANQTWSPTGNLVARGNHTATLLQDGKVLVAGGSGGAFGSARAELYDPASGTWMTTGSLVNGRRDHTATLLSDGNVLVAGGRNGDSSLASAELYGKSMPTLLNISTRARVLRGDKVLIGGFIITGTEQKTVIVRGIGPSLPVAGALADPVIEVHGPSGELLGTNDNWGGPQPASRLAIAGLRRPTMWNQRSGE